MGVVRGHSVPVSLPRRWIGDLLYFSARVPTASIEQMIHVGSVARVRGSVFPTPSWNALLLKSFAVVAQRHAELRRIYLSWPWPRFYEHPCSVAAVVVERHWHDEPAVFFGMLHELERQSLVELTARLQRFKAEPVEQFGCFRRLIRIARWPRPLRRILGHLVFDAFGAERCHYFGTFALNSLANTQAQILQTVTPLTTQIYPGPVTASGAMNVRWVWDHRVYDGLTAVRLLTELESALNDEVLAELQTLHWHRSARAA